MTSEINKFLSVGYGDGYGNGDGNGDGYGDGYGKGRGNGDGDGDGYGNGDGYGDGNGYGDGDGYGDGNGFGYGNGYGDGDGDGNGDGGLVSINKVGGHRIYIVDGLPTAIFAIFGNYAKAVVLQADMSFRPCFVARVGNSFAHGKTLKEALKDAESKELSKLPPEERVKMFLAAYPDLKAEIPAKELFEWHHILTGSCLFGRQQFCKDHGIDIERDKFTLNEFVKLTVNSYGGEIIKKLAKKLSYEKTR